MKEMLPRSIECGHLYRHDRSWFQETTVRWSSTFLNKNRDAFQWIMQGYSAWLTGDWIHLRRCGQWLFGAFRRIRTIGSKRISWSNYLRKYLHCNDHLLELSGSSLQAGNVVTCEMVEELLLSGADIVKCGIGPGEPEHEIELWFTFLDRWMTRKCLYNTFEDGCRLSTVILYSGVCRCCSRSRRTHR